MSRVASAGPSVGGHAPDVVVTGLENRSGHGAPQVLAFVRDGGFERESAGAVAAMITLPSMRTCPRSR